MWDAPEFNPGHPLYSSPPTKRTSEEVEWAIEMANCRIACIPVDVSTPGLVVSLRDKYRGMSPEEFGAALGNDQNDSKYQYNHRIITKNLRESLTNE